MGLNASELMIVNTIVFTAMPSARVAMAAPVKIGARRSPRMAERRSFNNSLFPEADYWMATTINVASSSN